MRKHARGPSGFLIGTVQCRGIVSASVYSAVRHYLKAIEAAGTDGAGQVMMKMRSLPVDDMYVKGGQLREDGRLVHPIYWSSIRDAGKIIARVGLLPRAFRDPWGTGLQTCGRECWLPACRLHKAAVIWPHTALETECWSCPSSGVGRR